MNATIQVENLVKRFNGAPAVAGVSFEAEPGQVLGLLGPNGAGKTTLVRMLSTLVRPDAGRALIHGHDVVREPGRVRELIGLTGQYAAVDQDISGWENLYVIAQLANLAPKAARARADEMLERFALSEAGRRPVGGYSGGMRRRLDLAASLVGDPLVLFLDEPTTGLDPRSRNALWDEVRALAEAGTTVLLTTQYMEEAEALADTAVVIDHGTVIATGTTAQLRERIGGRVLHVAPEHPEDLGALRRALLRSSLGGGLTETDGVLELPLNGEENQLAEAARAVGGAGVPLGRIDTCLPSLDEAFLSLTAQSGPSAAGAAGTGPAEDPTDTQEMSAA